MPDGSQAGRQPIAVSHQAATLEEAWRGVARKLRNAAESSLGRQSAVSGAASIRDDQRVSLDLPAILDAARIGRISTLLRAQDAAPPADGSQGKDPLDASAVGTLRHGGEVQVLPDEAMPAVAAAVPILRYRPRSPGMTGPWA